MIISTIFTSVAAEYRTVAAKEPLLAVQNTFSSIPFYLILAVGIRRSFGAACRGGVDASVNPITFMDRAPPLAPSVSTVGPCAGRVRHGFSIIGARFLIPSRDRVLSSMVALPAGAALYGRLAMLHLARRGTSETFLRIQQ
jgi:hypothetical protein